MRIKLNNTSQGYSDSFILREKASINADKYDDNKIQNPQPKYVKRTPNSFIIIFPLRFLY